MSKNRKKIKKFIIYLDHELGQGAMGKVYLCYQQSHPKIPLAVKIINKKNIDHDQYLLEALKRELKVHKQLKHPNIVQMIDYEQTKNNYYIFQQFCEGSSLRQMISRQKKFSQCQVIIYAKQIIHGFSQIVSKGIIHRDLKPENLLITSDTIKICDFGLSKTTFTRTQLTASLVGSPAYMAPQILKGTKYSSKCDVWSFGIILYELLYGVFPWGHKQRTTAGLLTQILTSPLSFPNDETISSQMKNFIQQCLKMQENLRLSWLEVFQHPLFEGQFDEIATDFRNNFSKAASLLDNLAARVSVSELVGSFLKFQVKSLDFTQFQQVIKWERFIPEATSVQIGFMYEIFDKDCNGVIDLYEFVKAFEICDENIPLLLNQLVQQGLKYTEMKDQRVFNKACMNKQYSKQIKNISWQIIDSLTFHS